MKATEMMSLQEIASMSKKTRFREPDWDVYEKCRSLALGTVCALACNIEPSEVDFTNLRDPDLSELRSVLNRVTTAVAKGKMAGILRYVGMDQRS
jgi:hypothetical protein